VEVKGEHMTQQIPSIGRIVHYVVGVDFDGKPVKAPAIVVAYWSGECVNLQVFVDGCNHVRPLFHRFVGEKAEWSQHGGEGWSRCHGIAPSSEEGRAGLMWRTSAGYDATGERPGSWHWPPRV
jgi:hypothetical protein